MDLIADDRPTPEELRDLYLSVGWDGYAEDPKLVTAVENSTYVVSARVEGQLIGLARGVSDDVSIFYLQDVLVRPEHQGQGVGTQLLSSCLDRFSHVRQKVLLTDDEERQHALYRSLGFSDVASLEKVPIRAFVRIEGLDLH